VRLLYPDDPLNQRQPDGPYLREYEIARARGIATSIFSFEDFERGRFDAKPRPTPGEAVLYRGWMLNPDGYLRLVQALAQLSVRAIVSPHAYRAAHHLPAWYPLVQDLTAETKTFAADSDFAAAFAGLSWPGYFVKDYVKSLNTGAGSLVKSPAEIARVVAQLRKYRGEIEGGICVRREERYVAGSERRYFIAGGHAFTVANDVPEVVSTCAGRIASPFFAVDIACRTDGVLRIIEIGDGQVSDRKEWPPERMVEVLEHVPESDATRVA
jgi:hypothetical protein